MTKLTIHRFIYKISLFYVLFVTHSFDKSNICNKINNMHDKAVKLLEDIEANKLPSLPHILVKLLQACRDEEICFDTLSEIISQDASLTSKVIIASNSPVYGRARHLNSLKHTLMFLGLNTIKSISITASIKQFFSEYSNEKTQFLKNFWLHSLHCATIARSLAELTSYPHIEEAYVAGLLHDIGKLMFEPKMGEDYKLLNHGYYPSDQILNSENQAWEFTHAELAASMLTKWNMPDVICDAVKYHHASIEEIQPAHHLAKIINISCLLASELESENNSIKTDAAIQVFDLSESIINTIVDKAKSETRALATSMDIDIGDDENNQKKDEFKQIQLAQEVRDTALVQNSQANISIESKDFFKSIQQSISLLFGINNSLFFCLDNSQQFLTMTQHQQQTDTCLFDDLKIDMDVNCILTRSLTQHQITDSFSAQQSASLNILDEQISHGLNSDGFICLPIMYSNQKLGVLLLGSSQNKILKHLENKQLLNLFSENLASKLFQYLDFNQKISEISKTNSEIYLERARKIIHETNNPLSVIRNYLQLLSKRLNENDPAQNELNIIKQEIDRIGNIILRCKDNPGEERLELTEVDINKLLTELITIYKSSLFATHDIRSTLKLDKKISVIKLDKNTFKQIVTNLLKNAVEAIENNGEITITTGTININGKNFVELKLQDTGPGITPEIMNNLYKPVTSTKGQKHSGLGLSITKNLVDRINGLISCRTNETGTTFSIQFPET